MRKILKFLGVVFLLLIAAVIVYLIIKGPELARLTTQISAKWACQCRYIDGGTNEFCIEEDPTGFPGLDFSFTPGERAVTVEFFGGWPSTGTYLTGRGCMVE